MEDRGRARALAARWAVGIGGAVVLALATAAGASGQDPLGKTTVEQRIVPDASAGFRNLMLGGGEAYTVREEGVGTARPRRDKRRRSLLYVGQLSDFQLADEESPARVEFVDTGPFSAAWRPWEALNPQIDDAMVRQVNAFAGASPVRDGKGDRRAMDLAINTGDLADSQQLNETEWVRTLLEGGPLDSNSGIDTPPGYPGVGCNPLLTNEGPQAKYTGVQDYDDYFEGSAPQFYDPDEPKGAYVTWPAYPGLMDRAQQPFHAAGLAVPSYVAIGNHDALVQGNAAANRSYEDVAIGCMKMFSAVITDPGSLADAIAALDPQNLVDLLTTDPTAIGLVPPDPKRQFVSKQQYKQVFLDGSQADGHGFAHVDPAEEAASAGAAGYYSWSPQPGFRLITLDTVSEGGVIGPSSDGNIDDPQFRWLRDELADAERQDQLVVVISHHAIPSLTANVPDEAAPPCTTADPHGHDVNPGCDLDPRDSAPIRLGEDLERLLLEHPHAIAWIAGHSHVNSIEAHARPGGGGFWSIRVAAEADWPQQTRLLEFFDNRDGTLSIFGTIVDHASAATAPPPGPAGALAPTDLASLGRTLAYNDTQAGGRACEGAPCGEGDAADRNVELLVGDPRRGGSRSGRCAHRLTGTPKRDRLRGTRGGDRIRGRAGKDRINGRRGKDCIQGGRGADRIKGGRDRDKLRGGGGADRINGGKGRDKIRGGAGADRVNARDRDRDRVHCGAGRDRVRADRKDRVRKSCERVRRRR